MQLTQTGPALALSVVPDPRPEDPSAGGTSALQRVRQVLTQLREPTSVQRLRQLCGMRTATVCAALAQLSDQGVVSHDSRGYQVTGLKKERAGLVSELNRLKIELAEHVLKQPGDQRKVPRRSQAEVLESIAVAESALVLADQRLDKLPAQISFAEAHGGEKLQRFDYEKKRFLDCIKVFGYNLKVELCRRLLNHYDRQKELLPALAMIVIPRAGGDNNVHPEVDLALH